MAHSIDPRQETIPGLRNVSEKEHEIILPAWKEEIGKRPRKNAGKIPKVIGGALCGLAVADLIAADVKTALLTAVLGIICILAGRSNASYSARKNNLIDNLEKKKYWVAPAYATKMWVTGDADSQSHGFCEVQLPNGDMLPGIYRMPTLVVRTLKKQNIESCNILLIQLQDSSSLLTIPVL